MHPNLVITAARTDKYIDTPQIGLGKPGSNIVYTPNADARLWSQGLASTLRRLNRAGIPVVIVHPVPVVSPVSISNCAAIRILTKTCTSSAARTAVEHDLRSSVDAEDRAAAAAPKAWTIDLTNQLCGPDRCPTTRSGTVLYRDSTHLSVDGALALTNTFYRAILAHARKGAAVGG